MFNEGMHSGEAYDHSNLVWEYGLRRFDAEWNWVNIGSDDTAHKELLFATAEVVSAAVPVEKVIVEVGGIVFKSTYKAGSHLVTTGSKLYGGKAVKLAVDKTTSIIGRYKGGIEFIKATGYFR